MSRKAGSASGGKKIIILAVGFLFLSGCQYLPDLNQKINWNWTAPEDLNVIPGEEADYENISIEEHTDLYDLTGNYPEFILSDKAKQDKVNVAVKNKVDLIVNNFKDGTSEGIDNLSPELISELDFDYGLDNLDNQLTSLHFNIFNYNAGAAHGFDYFETLNYDLVKDKKLTLQDVFRADTKYLEKLSQLGNDYFSQQFEQGYFHPEGVEPRNENWVNFALTPDSIIFYFADYAVAPYSEGTQELEISRVDLKDYIMPEYQPSAEDVAVSENEAKTYEDVEYDFEFTYPANYIYEDYEMYMFLTQNPLVSIGVPPEEFSGTNLSEAQFIVGVSEEENILEICEQKQVDETAVGEEIINGLVWQVFHKAEPAAGNLYDSTLYRLVDSDVCYELALLLHSGNIGNYDPGTVTEFNREEITAKLKSILETFEISGDWE